MTTVQFAEARTYWEPPPPPAPSRGLFDVAEVVDAPDPHLMIGAEYLTNRCTGAGLWADMCSASGTKTFNGLTAVVGSGFAVYDALECEIGESQDELRGRLLGSLAVKSEAVCEARLQTILKSSSVTASTSLRDAVGLLEQALAAGYAGRGLIHMDRYTAVAAASYDLVDHGTGTTVTGTPVVMGRGYTRATGKTFAAASGRVVVLRGKPVVAASPITANLPGRVLVEQQFMVLAECVKVWTEAAP